MFPSLLWRLRIGVLLVTAVALSPLIGSDFSCWDDSDTISQNPRIVHPTAASLGYYWTHDAGSLYMPVTYTVWWLIAPLAKIPGAEPGSVELSPLPFHIASLVVHLIGVLVVFEILRLAFPSPWAAAAGALLYGIHPMQVEAVGWTSGLKDVLGGMFVLVAIWQYVIHVLRQERPWRGRYPVATAAAIAGILSKPTAVVAPLLAGILVLWIVGRPRRTVFFELGLWGIVSAGAAIVVRFTEQALYPSIFVPLWKRPLMAGDALAFYFFKLIWPVQLAVDYGRAPTFIFQRYPYYGYWTWIAPMLIAALLWRVRRKWPALIAAAAIFILALLPVLGFFRFMFQVDSTVTDHYLYLAMLGPTIAAATVVARLQRGTLAILLILIAMAAMTFRQASFWTTGETLFEHELSINPASYMSYGRLWLAAVNKGHARVAEAAARGAIAIHPERVESYDLLATALEMQHRDPDAMMAYRAAIEVAPNNPVAYNGLANIYVELGQPELAIPLYQQAIKLNPDFVEARTGLAIATSAIKR